MFRFRKIDNILNCKNELKDQYIYFSSIKKLNDPCEGLGKVIFSTENYADWMALFVRWFIPEIIEKYSFLHKIALGVESLNLSTDIDLFCKNTKGFFERYNVDDFITEELKSFIERYLVNQKITKTMLISILCDLENDVRNIVNLFIEHGEPSLIKYNTNNWILPKYHNTIDSMKLKLKLTKNQLEKWENTNAGELLSNFLCNKINRSTKENRILNKKIIFNDQRVQSIHDELKKIFKKDTHSLSYPEEFVNGFADMLNNYSEVGVACFCKTYSSVRMWSEYSGMDGVCLEFDFGEYANLKLEDNPICIPIFPVKYSDKLPEKNFFKSIKFVARIHEKAKANEQECMRKFLKETLPFLTTKLKDYDNEEELRMIAFTGADKKFKYKFSDLKSITFAPQASIENQKKVIEIVEEKCKQENRKEFTFYQAYLDDDGKMTRD